VNSNKANKEMNKNALIGILILIILLIGGYFIWQGTSKKTPIASQSDKAIDTSQNQHASIIPNNNPTTSDINTKHVSPQNPNTTTQQKDPVLSNWKTYTNTKYGFTFQYPDTWTKNGEESNTINRKGEVMAISVNLIDTATQSVFSLIYSLPPYGPEVYKIEEDQYNSYKSSDEVDIKKNIIAGNDAVETFTTMSKDIHGNIYDPALKLIHIVFLDKQKTGAFNLNFRTPELGSEKEISKFNQLLPTFKFINKPTLKTN
jgi:hypothetical protein